jgi:uncharacterized CHY-type Zn-finger protein
MNSDKFYDFDTRSPNSIEPKYQRDDLLDDDSNGVLCDICNDGIRLMPYRQNELICPRCMNVFNPIFDTIKHDVVETTIEELQDTHSGTMAYVDEVKEQPHKSRIRKKLATEELPWYVKEELENIHWRKGYKTVPLDKEKLSDRTRK